MSDNPPLDPWRFDSLVRNSRTKEKLWGLNEIANAMGVSKDKVRRLSKLPNVPIYQNEGGYFALFSELMAWARQKQK